MLVLLTVIVTMVGLLGVAGYFALNKTTAAGGDFAVYRQATATSSITTTPTDLQFDQTVNEGTGFSIDGGDTNVTLSEAGHYLVMYNVGYTTNSTANQRSEIQAYIDLNGIDLEYGRSSCYLRRNGGAFDCWLAGAAIVEATTTDLEIKVESVRTDNVGADVETRANEAGFMIVRLDDNWDYARIQDSTGGQTVNSATYADINLDQNDELDAGTFSRSGSDITLADAGHYLVTSNVMFQNSTGNSRRTNATRLTLNGYELPGTRVNAYIRGSNSNQDFTASYVGVIEATTTNQILNLEAACDSVTCGNITTVGGQVGITIAKLPDTAQFVRLTENDTTSERTLDGTNDPITWDNQDEVDSSFTHDTGSNASRITVQTDGDYLFFSSFYSDRIISGSDGNRLYPHWEWRVNGTIQQYGSFGRFNRGDQSTTDAFRAGAAGGMLFNNLSSGDYVEVANTEETTGTDSGATFEGLRQGIQGIRIDSLIPKDVTVSSQGSHFATTTIPSNDFHVGGAFVLTPNNSSETITEITLTASGTVDLQNDIDDIRLFYEFDNSLPYDCASESFTSTTTETQFGGTDSDGFSATGATSTFTGSVAVTNSQSMCVYVLVDGPDTITDGETFEVYIEDPSTDVVIASGQVDPEGEIVSPTGFTEFQTDILTQTHFHWRNDDGNEGDTITGATSATDGNEDTILSPLSIGVPHRLRMQVSNEGSARASSSRFRLEYATSSPTCSAATTWIDVGSGGAWDMFNSANLTDGNNTTNISSTTRGALTDENTTFLTTNGGVKDTSSQVTGISLASTTFAELEYSIAANAAVDFGTTYCFRVSEAGTAIKDYDVYPQATIAADVQLSASGTQAVGIDKDTDDVYVDGMFVFEEQISSRDIDGITITASGTLDVENDTNDVRLFYDIDSTSPIDCTGETFDGVGSDTQFGSNGSFSAAGTSTFTDTGVTISTAQSLCVYVVMDIDADPGNGQTLDIEIADPKSDIVLSTGSIAPSIAVPIPGFSQINGGVMVQAGFHWRKDDGDEGDSGTGATSTTAGIQDTNINFVAKGDTQRLRFAIDNVGIATSTAKQFRLEYAPLVSTCSAVGSWTDVGAVGGAWDMSESANLTDGDNTTNIAISAGGVADVNTNFVTPNAGVKDLSSQTAGISLEPDEFAEVEYSIEATTGASDGTTYCFRMTDAGTALETYSVYPQATTRPEQDFYIQRGTTSIAAAATVSTITAGVDYTAPSDPSKAFIRITNTQHTGAGDDFLGGTQQADDVSAYISNPDNLMSSIDFTRIGNTDNTRIAWEIIEYIGPVGGGNEIEVHHSNTVTFGTGDVSTSSPTINGISDDNDVVVFITGAGSPHAGTASYNTFFATADWEGVGNTADFLRAETDTLEAYISYSVVEFVGDHWFVQRVEHPYGTDTDETEVLPTAVSTTSAFLHVQKRIGSNDGQLEELGQEVYFNQAGTELTFRLETGADNPTGHTGVAWVIENQQVGGDVMEVTRSTGTQAGGAEPATVNVNIGTTISALDNASIFMVNRVTGTGSAHPRAMISTRLISDTQYELWISDTGQTRTYRTEVVEWPTASRELTQNYYLFFADNDLLDPTDPWPAGPANLGENTVITANDEPIEPDETVRIRMTIAVDEGALSANTKRFKLQYGERQTSCSAISAWTDLAPIGSTTALWRGANTSVTDGDSLSGNPPTASDLNISIADRAGSFEEENLTALNPFKVALGEDVEYDWAVERGTAPDSTYYCFRMVESNDTVFDNYNFYPTLVTAGFEVHSDDWKWFDDETSLTPTSDLAATNTAPASIAVGNLIKLRMIMNETAGLSDTVKYKLQYSETSDFSGAVHDVADMDECLPSTQWCYGDGAGTDHATITERVLGTADPCSGASGTGCGTHNEYSYVPNVIGEVGTSSTDSTGTTINLEHTYTDPVFIIESIEGDNTGPASNDPAAAIITATTSNSFTVEIQEPDDEDGTHGTESFAYMVIERGAHTLPDGTRIDAGRLQTNNFYGNNVSGTDDTCSFTQTFAEAPVVLSALQTDNNTGGTDFFTVSQNTITASQFTCAIEVPDGSSNAPSSDEVIGWVAISAGTTTNNTIPFVVATTSESVLGWTETWHTHNFVELLEGTPGVMASKLTRNGAEGGWVRFDEANATSTQFAMDEADGLTARTHAAETVGFIAFTKTGTLYDNTLATSTLTANASVEYEWTLTQNAAHIGVAYFFRAYDVERDIPIVATSSYPSVVADSGSLSFILSGIDSGTSLEGVVTDATSTPSTISFTGIQHETEYEAAHRLTVSTNGTHGYQVFLQEESEFLDQQSNEIPDVLATNAVPLSWSSACTIPAVTGCWGYHAGDNTLSGGSTRFLIHDTYAEISSTPEEVAFSSGPVTNEQTEIIYKLEVDIMQPAGDYSSSLQYIVVPVF